MSLVLGVQFLVIAFVCLRSATLAYDYAVAHATIRAVLYGVLAVLALLSLVFQLFHL